MVKHLGNNNFPDLTLYNPNYLDRVERVGGDRSLYNGIDYWNAYEFAYLNSRNQSVFETIELKIPSNSCYTVESKSLKLYLASFFNKKFYSPQSPYKLIARDIQNLIQSPVKVQKKIKFLIPPKSILLNTSKNLISKNKVMKFKGFRSVCPVTSQPDWASIYFHSTTDAIDASKLNSYLKSFRLRGDFHETCIESIFVYLLSEFSITNLTVFGRFLRRGGIDINPIRSTAKRLIFKNFRDFNQ